jgi:hypothetical protein
MIRQDADGVCFEQQARCNRTINLPQAIDVLAKQLAGPISKRNREKEYPAFNSRTPISRHNGLWHGRTGGKMAAEV